MEVLSYICERFLDRTLDISVYDNARFAIAKKIFLFFIENSRNEVLIRFFGKYGKKFEEIIANGCKEFNVEDILRWAQEHSCVLRIIDSIYKKLSIE